VTISAATDQLTKGIHLCLPSSVPIDIGILFVEHPGKWTFNKCSYASYFTIAFGLKKWP